MQSFLTHSEADHHVVQVPVAPADTRSIGAGVWGIDNDEDEEPQAPGAPFMLYSTAIQLNRAESYRWLAAAEQAGSNPPGQPSYCTVTYYGQTLERQQ